MAHILIADDDFEDRMIMSESFKELKQDHSLSFVEDGGLVLDFLGDNKVDRVDLIVLDLNMPRVNGTETLKLLKTHPVFKEIPVVIFSTSVNDLEREKCIALGARAYLTKPGNYAAYLETCKKFIALATEGVNEDKG